MPGFITHYVFGKEEFKRIKEGVIKESIRKHRNVYNIGLQGPDIFFYFPAYFLISRKNLGTIMHHSEVNPFFEEILNYINKVSPRDREILIAYVAGFLGHHTLDSSVHPYIYYFTGYKEGEKGYFSRHAVFETEIDYYMSRNRLKKDAYYFNMASVVRLNEREYKVIGDAISYVCSKIYKVRRYPWVYRILVKAYSFEIGLFKDATGKKAKLVENIEKIVMGHKHFSPLIIQKNHKRVKQDILNVKKTRWNNYWDNSIVSNQGFMELFEESKTHYINVLNLFERCLNSSESMEYRVNKDNYVNIIGNKSYRSGLSYNHRIH